MALKWAAWPFSGHQSHYIHFITYYCAMRDFFLPAPAGLPTAARPLDGRDPSLTHTLLCTVLTCIVEDILTIINAITTINLYRLF